MNTYVATQARAILFACEFQALDDRVQADVASLLFACQYPQCYADRPTIPGWRSYANRFLYLDHQRFQADFREQMAEWCRLSQAYQQVCISHLLGLNNHSSLSAGTAGSRRPDVVLHMEQASNHFLARSRYDCQSPRRA
jgi:hypothetical protein